MVIRLKDTAKLFGITIIACCAVFVCTLFLSYNIDLAAIKDEITTEAGMAIPIRQIPSLCDCDEHKRVERYAITCCKAESDNYLLKISGSSRFRHNPQRGQ